MDELAPNFTSDGVVADAALNARPDIKTQVSKLFACCPRFKVDAFVS